VALDADGFEVGSRAYGHRYRKGVGEGNYGRNLEPQLYCLPSNPVAGRRGLIFSSSTLAQRSLEVVRRLGSSIPFPWVEASQTD